MRKIITVLAVTIVMLMGMTAARAQYGCTPYDVTATGYLTVYNNADGKVVNVQAGYYTGGSPASVSTILAAGYFSGGLATPADLGSAATNTTGADLGSQNGQYPVWAIHTSTLSSGGVLHYMVCVSQAEKTVPMSTVATNSLIKGGGAGTASGVSDNGTTVSTSESITATGGLVANSRYRILDVPISVVSVATGTNKTMVAGTTYCADVFLSANKTITGVGVMAGGTAGAADLWIVALYAAGGGAPLANSALTGTASPASTYAFTEYAFTGTYAAAGPGVYFACVQSNGTADKVTTIPTLTFSDVRTKSTTGVFATLPTLAAPSTFTQDVGPVLYLY